MYKTHSKFLQRVAYSTATRQKASAHSTTAAEKANERRAPFFYRIKKFSSDDKGAFPDWLKVEIREAGGPRGWIKKNAYWQKILRQQYHSVIADKSKKRKFKKLIPKWLFEEVCSFGRVHWLKVHAAKGGEKGLRTDRNSRSPEDRSEAAKEDLDNLDQSRRTPRRIIVRDTVKASPAKPMKKAALGHKKVRRKRKKKKSKYEDALDHAVSGGAFDSNRRRH